MRFERIENIHDRLEMAREECIAELVSALDIVDIGIGKPRYTSELERVLANGKSIARATDFYVLYEPTVFDHSYMFRCRSGLTFLYTLPYNSRDGFYCDFRAFIRGYYKEKRELEGLVEHSKPHTQRRYEGQFLIKDTMDALVVDDRYKIRENGDFAAIIAMNATMAAFRPLLQNND